MPTTEDMRRTVKAQLRITPEAAEALETIPRGTRSAWVSDLIVRAARRLGWIKPRSQAHPKD